MTSVAAQAAKPPIALEEFRQGKVVVESLGLMGEPPVDLEKIASEVREIITSSAAVQGVCQGDYDSLVLFSAVYWGIVKTFPRTVIRNVRNFLNRFNDGNSSRDLLFVFNFTDIQRVRVLESMQHGISGIVKDYGFEEGSHMDYWKELMTDIGMMENARTGRLSDYGKEVMAQVNALPAVQAIDCMINKEFDQRDALVGMLAVEFLAAGASASIVEAGAADQLFESRSIPKTWFEVHYHVDDHADTLADPEDENSYLELPHDTISFNMAQLAHKVDHDGEDFHAFMYERIINIARAFASAGDQCMAEARAVVA